MTYLGMPFGMWTMFAGSFQKQLTVVFGYDVDTAKAMLRCLSMDKTMADMELIDITKV